jgi:hypothetical protein
MKIVQAIPKVVLGTGQATQRGNEDTSHDMGRNETTQRVKTMNDIQSLIDRIEESFHLDCLMDGGFIIRCVSISRICNVTHSLSQSLSQD